MRPTKTHNSNCIAYANLVCGCSGCADAKSPPGNVANYGIKEGNDAKADTDHLMVDPSDGSRVCGDDEEEDV